MKVIKNKSEIFLTYFFIQNSKNYKKYIDIIVTKLLTKF